VKRSGSSQGPEAIGHAVREHVEAFLRDVAPPVNHAFADRIELFATTMARWGIKMNLTAHPDDPEEIGFHVIDSLMPLALTDVDLIGRFAASHDILDLGSGAGFPGLVVAAASSGRFTLVESRRKRASFLQVATAEMQLTNVVVDSRRANQVALDARFDVVMGRAFGDPNEFFALAMLGLKPGGLAILYANPSQSFGAGVRRIPYRIPRHGQQVDRILAVQKRI